MESQLELLDELKECTAEFNQALPDTMGVHDTFRDAVYEDGALSHKAKRLIALGIALRAGATGCILAQTRAAVEAGATKAEILEAVSVATVMGGTPARGWSWRVVKLLKELGKW